MGNKTDRINSAELIAAERELLFRYRTLSAAERTELEALVADMAAEKAAKATPVPQKNSGGQTAFNG